MARIQSRKHKTTTPLVALAASLPFLAQAETFDESSVVQLPKIEATAQANKSSENYKANEVSSPKYTQPIIDTPQTISVIKKELLQELWLKHSEIRLVLPYKWMKMAIQVLVIPFKCAVFLHKPQHILMVFVT